MTRTEHYAVEFVESFPSPMEPGVLYASIPYSTAGHICACGCGREIVTKLSPARYRVVFDGEVSLRPSVAATGLPCNSHYFITRGQVEWHPNLDSEQVARARAADRRAVEDHRPTSRQSPSSWWRRILRRHRA